MNAIKSLRCQVVGHDHQRRNMTQHISHISCSVCHDVHLALSPRARVYRIHDREVAARRPPARFYGLQARITNAA